MTNLLKIKDPRLEKLKCDICHNPAEKWFGETSATVCNSKVCHATYQKYWDEQFDNLEDE